MALFVLLGALVWLSYSSGCFCFVGSWGPAVLFGFVLGFREEGVGPKLPIDILLGLLVEGGGWEPLWVDGRVWLSLFC